MSKHKVHFSRQTDLWSTPQWIFDALDREFHFTLDPCSDGTNAKCAQFFTAKEDGLKQDWGGHVVFMNPPYSKVSAWMRKAWLEGKKGTVVVCLVPARTDTRWWHQYAMKGELRFNVGRLKFGDAKNVAPFPSAIVIFGRVGSVPITGYGVHKGSYEG